MTIQNKIKVPFSYFGGKRRVAPIIWKRFGNVSNYVEPFCGGLSVLLNNPNPAKIETINDIDSGLTNWWRAVSNDPDEVVKYADYPVSELDLHARQQWLCSILNNDFIKKMELDPNFFDIKAAAWWVWGISSSTGNNFMQDKGLNALPSLSSAGNGILGLTYNIKEEFLKLQNRLKRVRITCGDWKRVITPALTHNNVGLSKNDITGVFLDPPYDLKKRDKIYKNETNIFNEVCEWSIKNGNNPKLRIAVCGYEGDYQFPETWEEIRWKADGGYSGLGEGNGKINSKRETIWLSPNCLKITENT